MLFPPQFVHLYMYLFFALKCFRAFVSLATMEQVVRLAWLAVQKAAVGERANLRWEYGIAADWRFGISVALWQTTSQR